MVKKKPTLAAAWKIFGELSDDDKQSFVRRLSAKELAAHPQVLQLIDALLEFEETADGIAEHNRLQLILARVAAEEKIPRKRGKPERDVIILRLHGEGRKPAAIGRHQDVVAANDGETMCRQAVELVIKRKLT